MSHLHAPTPAALPEVPDLLTVDVAVGTKVFVTSDLHFPRVPSEASRWAESEVSRALGEIEGPALLVLAGDVIELWAGEEPSASAAMTTHPKFVHAVAAFNQREDRRVICLPGNHDGRLGWDTEAVRVVQDDLGAELTFAVDLVLATAEGVRTVHIEHGHAFDPANRFADPRDPNDHPLGQHIVQEVLPDLARSSDASLLHGVESLADPRTFPAFVTSRVFYHRVVRAARWLLLPLVFAIGIHYGITILDEPARLRLRARDLVIFDIVVIVAVALTALVLMLAGHKTWHSATSGGATAGRGREQNDNSRAGARELVTNGYAGLICGHTHHPELTPLGRGFYANTGSGTRVIEQFSARFRFPHIFLTRLQLSWIEMEAGPHGWQVQLWEGYRPAGKTTRMERLLSGKADRAGAQPAVVKTYPD
jgi:UDP-2,3-diacylglucosamine pyrophosphatase LpxH